MRTSLITTIVLTATLAGAVPGTKAASIFESDAELTPGSEIDKLVLDRLQQLGIQPARVCSDEVFVRRVYLDVIGTLPTSDEAREFLKDQDPQKRRALIDRLLERSGDRRGLEGQFDHQQVATTLCSLFRIAEAQKEWKVKRGCRFCLTTDARARENRLIMQRNDCKF